MADDTLSKKTSEGVLTKWDVLGISLAIDVLCCVVIALAHKEVLPHPWAPGVLMMILNTPIGFIFFMPKRIQPIVVGWLALVVALTMPFVIMLVLQYWVGLAPA